MLINAINYSTEEQVIGTWIDGKPLYQKTILTTSPGALNTTVTVLTATTIDHCQVIQFKLLRNNNGGIWIFSTMSAFHEFDFNPNSKAFTWWNSNGELAGRQMIFTYQYTKTTD